MLVRNISHFIWNKNRFVKFYNGFPFFWDTLYSSMYCTYIYMSMYNSIFQILILLYIIMYRLLIFCSCLVVWISMFLVMHIARTRNMTYCALLKCRLLRVHTVAECAIFTLTFVIVVQKLALWLYSVQYMYVLVSYMYIVGRSTNEFSENAIKP